jgi:hypothetical protein
MWWNIINTFLASIGIGLAIWGISYGRKQFHLSKRQDEDQKAQAKDDEEWAAKFALAARNLTAIGNKIISVPQYGVAYQVAFPDVELRHRIEAHLINQDFSNMNIQVRSLSSDQLRPPDVRRTISDVLAAVDHLKKENPQAARVLGIP